MIMIMVDPFANLMLTYSWRLLQLFNV